MLPLPNPKTPNTRRHYQRPPTKHIKSQTSTEHAEAQSVLGDLHTWMIGGVILACMCVKNAFTCVSSSVSILGPFWAFWVHFGSILGPFWVHFGSILGPFWVHFGSIWGSFWVHFAHDLSGDVSFNQHSNKNRYLDKNQCLDKNTSDKKSNLDY